MEKRNAYMLLVGYPEGKTLLRRPICRWLDNIKIDFWRDRIEGRLTGLICLRIRKIGELL
jgi:hypothetical protein